MNRPGEWLRIVAAWLCKAETMDRVVDPILADMQQEYADRRLAGHRWRARGTCVRGYVGFWKAVSLYTIQNAPRTLADAVAADGWALARMIAHSVAVCVVLTLLLSAEPIAASYPRVPSMKVALLLLPQAIAISIPIAVPFGIASAMGRMDVSAARIRRVLGLALAGTLLAFVAMGIIPSANDAWRRAMVEIFHARGISEYSLPRGMNEMSVAELAGAIETNEATGSLAQAAGYRRAYHMRSALPAATLVLSLLALSLCAITSQRVFRILALAAAFGAYYVALALVMARPSISVLPAASIWAPNIVFAILSLGLLRIWAPGSNVTRAVPNA